MVVKESNNIIGQWRKNVFSPGAKLTICCQRLGGFASPSPPGISSTQIDEFDYLQAYCLHCHITMSIAFEGKAKPNQTNVIMQQAT